MHASEPGSVDVAVRDAVVEALRPVDGAYQLSFAPCETAKIWFTEVTPSNLWSASMSFGFDTGDIILVSIGNAHFEVFPSDASSADYIASIVTAVLEGKVEESGSTSDASVRIHTSQGVVSAGPVRVPWPWRLRHVRMYEAYTPAA